MLKNFFVLLFLFCASLAIRAEIKVDTISLPAGVYTVASLTDKVITIDKKTDYHITSSTCAGALKNTKIKLKTDKSWLFFDNIRPQTVIDSLMKYIYADESLGINKANLRVSIYKQGAVIMLYPSTVKPLTVFNGQNYSGDSTQYKPAVYNTALGVFDNKIRSFKLKRGYMATVASNADGSGYSRVFIADDKDLEIPTFTYLLDQTISFIRVFEWEYVNKKGKAGWNPNDLNATSYYDWNIGGSSTENYEYVAIRQNGGWPGWADINNKPGITHVLGFNEPDHTEQSNLTVAQALAQWPEMMKSGLRIGSPACTNFGWLYQFYDSCMARNYRLDFIAIHAYWGGKSTTSWYNDIKYISDRCGGRPVWITEWNNGANWTTEVWPTVDRSYTTANAAKQLNDITAILGVLDNAPFIERYHIYDWVQDCRAMVLSSGLTEAGKYYKKDPSQMAFNRAYEVVPTYKMLKNPKMTSTVAGQNVTLSITDPNGDYFRGFILEKKMGDGNYVEIANTTDKTIKTFTDSLDFSQGNVKYRVKTKLADGTYSNYTSDVSLAKAEGESFQFGRIGVNNLDFNPVFYSQPYAAIPSIVAGAITNNNSLNLLTPRVKYINYTQRFGMQAAAWSYQGLSGLAKEEKIPFLVAPAGKNKLGDLLVTAGRGSASTTWTQINFDTTFSQIPVVFANQLISGTAFATVLRIKDVSTTGFKVRVMKETGLAGTIGSESFTYIAIEPGVGKMEGHEIKVGKTVASSISPAGYYKVLFNDTVANPFLLAQMQTCNDDTVAAGLRAIALADNYVYLSKQREKSTTATTVAKEDAGWILINPVKTLDAVNVVTENNFGVYPTYTKGKLNINFPSGTNDRNFELYSMTGMLKENYQLKGNEIDVSNLAPGQYLLKNKELGVAKFTKL